MFRVKICGVRLKADIEASSEFGADAIGLNFFPPSVRYVSPDDIETRELSAFAQQAGLLRVGVFVNESIQRITQITETVGIDVVQLHGDEPPSLAKQLIEQGRHVVRAIKLPISELSVSELDTFVQSWAGLGCHLLLDADAGAAHGGSGKTLHWPSIRHWAASKNDLQWTLAGGLRQENVAEAIRSAGAVSVDTASGVECPKGVKNRGRIERFCHEALQAMQA